MFTVLRFFYLIQIATPFLQCSTRMMKRYCSSSSGDRSCNTTSNQYRWSSVSSPMRKFYPLRQQRTTIDDSRRNDSDELFEQAAQLRREIEEIENNSSRQRRRKITEDSSTRNERVTSVAYTDMKESVWTISYRFSDQPETQENSKEVPTEPTPKRCFYIGKLTLTFRSDGYTEIVSQESSGSGKATIIKVWGWDVEESNRDEDSNDYLIFSVDANLSSDVTTATKQRFYFQARLVKDIRSQLLTLEDGTVTIKQDLNQKSSRWALLSPAGILAQFRYVGDFLAKPALIS